MNEQVADIMALLDENEQEVLEDGGLPLSMRARSFLAESVREIICAEQPNLQIVPFARSDGGAHLIINHRKKEKRLTLHVFPDQSHASVIQTGRAGNSASSTIDSPRDVRRFLTWLSD